MLISVLRISDISVNFFLCNFKFQSDIKFNRIQEEKIVYTILIGDSLPTNNQCQYLNEYENSLENVTLGTVY